MPRVRNAMAPGDRRWAKWHRPTPLLPQLSDSQRTTATHTYAHKETVFNVCVGVCVTAMAPQRWQLSMLLATCEASPENLRSISNRSELALCNSENKLLVIFAEECLLIEHGKVNCLSIHLKPNNIFIYWRAREWEREWERNKCETASSSSCHELLVLPLLFADCVTNIDRADRAQLA